MWSQLSFQHHYSSLQCHVIFRNHQIWCSRNISDYHQCLKHCAASLHCFFKIYWWIESSKEQSLFEIGTFCNNINVFTVTFDQWNGFFLNKHIKHKKPTNPQVTKKMFLNALRFSDKETNTCETIATARYRKGTTSCFDYSVVVSTHAHFHLFIQRNIYNWMSMDGIMSSVNSIFRYFWL